MDVCAPSGSNVQFYNSDRGNPLHLLDQVQKGPSLSILDNIFDQM